MPAWCVKCGYTAETHGLPFPCRDHSDEWKRQSLRYYDGRPWQPHRPVTLKRGRLQVEQMFMPYALIMGIRVLFSFGWWATKITAQGWWWGHQTLVSWLRDTGERSRADAARALTAVGYLSMSFVAASLISLYALLAVIT